MTTFNKVTRFSTLLVFLLLIVMPFIPIAYAATSPSLGTAATYSVLAGSSVTNTGATTLSGDVGISPGAGGSPNYTGFASVTLGGTIHDADAAAGIAMGHKNDASTALADQTCDTTYAGTKELAGDSLVPGVYCANSFHLSSGTLTLVGTASDVWIFKSASDLIITGSSANVVFTGGGQPCNVWWRVVSTATLDAGSSFVGSILAGTSITLASGASLNGRALAGTAEVTLSNNSITGPTCVVTTPTPTASSSSSGSSSSSSSSNNNSTNNNVCPTPDNNTVPIVTETSRVSPTSIFIRWNAFGGTEQFNVRYGFTDGEWLYNTDVTGLSTTINDLPANRPIWFQVAARNSCSIGMYGVSKFSGGPRLPNTGFAPHNHN